MAQRRLTELSYIREIMRQQQTHFKKKYGQNFLCEAAVPARIAAECGAKPGSGILEIGPGVGALSQCLCERFPKVVAVEIDTNMVNILAKTMADCENFKVIEQDILKCDLPALIASEFAGRPVSVCANLPYYITTPVLMKLLESRAGFDSITVMVQKEVASRLCAAPGSAQYGAVTASVGYYASAKKLFDVPAGCFVPAPKVDSAVICLSLYQKPPVHVAREAMLFSVIRGAFAQRRKTLQNSLASALPSFGKEAIGDALSAADIEKTRRGETLSLADFAAIADALSTQNHR